MRLRAAWILAGLALLALPPAFAQTSPVPLVSLTVHEFEEPAPPLQGPVSTTVVAHVSCALVEAPGGVPVQYSILEKPPWARAVISPATDMLAAERCEGGWLTAQAKLDVTVDDQAPAYAPEELVLEVRAGGSARQERAEASVPVEAHYFSILDVQLPRAIDVVAPGATVGFPVTLANLGNGPTRVRFELAETPPTLQARLPSEKVLGSRQHGNPDTAADLEILVAAPPEDGLVNRVEVVNLRVLSEHAEDATRKGDESTISLLLTIRSENVQKLAEVPLTPLAALLSLGLAAWAFRR